MTKARGRPRSGRVRKEHKIRFSEEEKRLTEEAAKRDNREWATWVRQAAVRAAQSGSDLISQPAAPATDQEAVAEQLIAMGLQLSGNKDLATALAKVLARKSAG